MDIRTDHRQGIYAIDSGFGRPRLNAEHLIVANGHARHHLSLRDEDTGRGWRKS